MREMKDSGIEWIGLVPNNWKLKRGKYLFKQHNNRGNLKCLQLLSPSQKFGVIPQTLLEQLTTQNVVKVSEKANLNDFKTVHVGDFCISLRSFQGGFEYSRYEGVVSPAYQIFSAIGDNLCNGYYRYLFKDKSFIDKMNSYTMTLRDGKNIAFDDFGNTYIPVPPKSEQEKIAGYLDSKCSEIDAISADIQKEIETLEQYKRSILTEAVTKGVNPDVEMKDSDVSWIGKIPKNWYISKIKYICKFSPSCNTRNLTGDSIVSYAPMECIKNGYAIEKVVPYGTIPKSLTPFENGDIVMAKVTPCFENGNIAIMNDLASGIGFGSSELFVFRAKAIFTKYLFYWLQNIKFTEQAASTMIGVGGLKRVSSQFIRNSEVCLPPVFEQIRIANYLDRVCSEINILYDKKEQQLKILENYKKSLIYEYATGKKEVPV